MTTEDDFQKALDADPDDNQTRLVFADWLDEREDPRADGYRLFLSRTDVAPFEYSDPVQWTWFNELHFRRADCTGRAAWSFIPYDLFVALEGGQQLWEGRPNSTHDGYGWRDYPSRRAAEDAAARAFAQLPAKRRAELLAPKDTAPRPRARKKAPRKGRKPAARKAKGKGKK